MTSVSAISTRGAARRRAIPRSVARLAAAAPLLLLLLPGGCAFDPYDQPGTWRSGSVNDDNLAAMVVNQHDLIAGQPTEGSDGQLDAAAVDRLRTGKVKALTSASTTGGGSGGSSGGGSSGGGGGS